MNIINEHLVLKIKSREDLSKKMIICSKCNEVGGTENEIDPEQDFFDCGWRVANGEVYCPKCTEEYLR